MKNENPRIYAPVAIPTLCRYKHLKRCVETLSKCTGANQTELYIALDFPLKDSHWEGYRKISDYLPSIKGFKKVIVIRRDKNFGVVMNARDLLDVIHKKHDCYILSEDDNEFSPNFLEYINGGLNKYKDNPKVIAICGYVEPRANYNCMKSYPFNAYPMVGYNAWGVGVWFDKKPDFLISPEEILSSFRTVLRAIKLNHGIAIHRLMNSKRKGATGDLLWRLHCAFNNKYSIYPSISKVRNWGFDGSGSNCATLDYYLKINIDKDIFFKYDDFEIKDYSEVNVLQKRLYGLNFITYLAVIFEYFLYRITGGTCLRDIRIIRYMIIWRVKFSNFMKKTKK